MTAEPAIGRDAEIVVLLTTWNRPSLLALSLPQIQRESASVRAGLVISDDRSDDRTTQRLLAWARDCGADVVVRPDGGQPDRRDAELVHKPPRHAIGRLIRSAQGAELVSQCARQGHDSAQLRRNLWILWNSGLQSAYASTQENNLFGLRHVLGNYPRARWILKVDDDVQLRPHAFEIMRKTWISAERAGHDVLAVSGIRTVHERLTRRYEGFGLTVGVCNVTVLYRRADWERCLDLIPDQLIRDKGFDLAFAWDYAPQHRPGATAVCVMPSVALHAGRNGVNVRDRDINCDF